MDHATTLYLILVIILMLISAIFATSETSITAASRPKVHRMINEGNKRAKKLEKLLKSREKVISTMLIGNNVVNKKSKINPIITRLFIQPFFIKSTQNHHGHVQNNSGQIDH